MQLVHTLARRGATPDRVEREVATTIAGWISGPGSIEAIEALRGQLELAAEVTAAAARNGPGEYAPDICHAQRVVACLEAARDAAKAALAEL